MTRIPPIEIWKYFRIIFPEKAQNVVKFKHEYGNTIRLYLKTGKTLIFKVTAKDLWTLSSE